MRIIWLLKFGVFLYELIKIAIITTFLVIQGNDQGFFIKLVMIAPLALFPIMALFILLNASRYKAYLPLFAAGKCISLFLLLGWFIVSRQVTMIGSFLSTDIYVEMILLSGDFFTLAAVLLIFRYLKKSAEIQTKAEVEENQCE